MDFPANRPEFDTLFLPPISLQILLENAIKHNEFSRERPLETRIRIEADSITIENEIRIRRHSRPTSKVGLQNLSERCRLILNRDVEIIPGPSRFSVRLPLKSID
jgi:sensor histidine kinase YesM